LQLKDGERWIYALQSGRYVAHFLERGELVDMDASLQARNRMRITSWLGIWLASINLLADSM
jgi:hypothetical protein